MSEEEMKANEDMKNILDQEVLESLVDGVSDVEDGLKKIEKVLEETDIEDAVNDIFKEIGK